MNVKFCVFFVSCMLFAYGFGLPGTALSMPAFDISKMSDMSDFDPRAPIEPAGDVVKLGYMNIFSGPGAGNGELNVLSLKWAAHDINKRGGITVDGKKKKISILIGDTQGKPTITKKVAEKLCLEDKVDVIIGTSGSHTTLVIQNVAKKYKTIHLNDRGVSEALMNGKNFSRYTFRTCTTTAMFGQAMAYYYSKRPEKKFYILCQDYSYGHDIANSFKAALKKYKPDHEIVGDEYHPLFMKDFAPYLTKAKGSGAEVLYTGDWMPDSQSLVIQANDLGLEIQIANLYADIYQALKPIGPEAGKRMVNGNSHMTSVDTPGNKAINQAWNTMWKNWEKPYDTPFYKWPGGVLGENMISSYWLIGIIEKAASTDPEKIITAWEGDEYDTFTGTVKMRPCDHQMVREMFISQFEYPNPWFDDVASYGKVFTVPAEYCTQPLPKDLDRCNQ